MRRGGWAILGLLLLAAAVAAAPPVPDRGGSLLSELGQSLGGLGVLAVDGLFLRADSLRAAGRVEEVPALYQAALELDPDNPVAADFLVSILAVDLVNDAPDGSERLAWWTEAWALLERARARHPHDASLAMRGADLLLDLPARYPDLLPGVEAAVGDPRTLGIERLVEAARRTPTLRRRGRQHLEWIAFALPVVAAEQGPGASREAILRLGDEILELRRETLKVVQALSEGPDGEILATSMETILTAGLDAVRAFDAAEARQDEMAARAVVEALEVEWPDLPLLELLRARWALLR